jgi:DNA integrity scanning protein DisA with diadenylate cyclase activity
LQGCKAYRLCSVAVLNELGKEWWIDMKNVQISEELFVAIMRYFMLEHEELLPQIKQGMEKKLDAMVMRELYTKYKTALTEEEKEKARKEYLDRRGVPESFRWQFFLKHI